MNADGLLDKAMRAVDSARRLVEDGAYDDTPSWDASRGHLH